MEMHRVRDKEYFTSSLKIDAYEWSMITQLGLFCWAGHDGREVVEWQRVEHQLVILNKLDIATGRTA